MKVDSSKDELRLAGMTDLGNVIFSVASKGSLIGIVKNNSGWPDSVLLDIVVPILRQLTRRVLSKDCIVQELPDGRTLYRSFNFDNEVDEVELTASEKRVSLMMTRRFAWFGEKEYLRRIHVSEYGEFPGIEGSYPKRLAIVDEIGGYRADVSINRLKALKLENANKR
jgi:hypothetical protein